MIIEGSVKQLTEKAATILFDTTIRLLRKKKKVVIAVPGGKSVAGIYENFREYPLPWDRIHMFLLDERLVGADHPDSNYKLVREHMGSEVVPLSIHQFTYDAKNPRQSIVDYREELNRYGGRFDIVLASSGEDGHIGSLFPNHHSLQKNRHDFFLMDDSPKPPPGRMAASFDLIQRADTGIVLFFGSSKRKALCHFLNSQLSYTECPARIITRLPYYYVLTDQEVNVL
jgi:6-phosphogluconolactonase